LGYALERNCADRISLNQNPQKPVATEPMYRAAQKLDSLHGEMIDVLAPYAIKMAQSQEAHAFDVRDKLFGQAELAPTRLGNDVAALRSYCETRYGFEFDFFWPRLQQVIKNDNLAKALTGAKIQVDFFVLSFTLTVLFIAIWLIILAVWGRSFGALMTVVAAGPAVAAMWLWMIHESYSAYAELVRVAIDLSRFDLLQALRRPLPESANAERQVWDQMAQWLVLAQVNEDVNFKHPAS
jgi:hypothetical protein